MTGLTDIVIGDGYVRHLRDPAAFTTLCGSSFKKQTTISRRDHPYAAYPMCGNCARTNARYERDHVLPDIEAGATRRGAVLADEGRVREVTGRIFRVAGSTDTYTVLIPSDKDLASTCTCMAAKTHPEILCKHQSAVYLIIGGDV